MYIFGDGGCRSALLQNLPTQPLLLLLLQLRCPNQATDTRTPGECVGGVVRAAKLQ